MSDDGFAEGGYSPYSDLEDLLWDADPNPDLADDLACHATYSPIFGDDPGYELVEYYSDWDYYSDDYFDDDPALLKDQPVDASRSKTKVNLEHERKRGKKRKLAEVADIPELDLGERRGLHDCMRGTVWAQPLPERDNLHTSAKSPKVALLQDWKIRFGRTSIQPRDGDKGQQLQDDESWANDMSLADMGLMNARGSRLEQEGDAEAAIDSPRDDDEAEGEESGEKTRAPFSLENLDQPVSLETLKQLAGSMGAGMRIDIDDETLEQVQRAVEIRRKGALAKHENSMTEDDMDTSPSSPKRRKTQGILPSPPTTNESILIDTSEVPAPAPTESEMPLPTTQKRGRGLPRKSSKSSGSSQAQTKQVLTNRKRKASSSPVRETTTSHEPPTPNVEHGRAKRVASRSNAVGATSKQEELVTAASTRPTRRRKK